MLISFPHERQMKSRKKKPVRLWRLFRFLQRSKVSSTRWPSEVMADVKAVWGMRTGSWCSPQPPRLTLSPKSADLWRTLAHAAFSPRRSSLFLSLRLFRSFPEKTLKVAAAAAQLTRVFPSVFFSPPSHKCFSTGTSCTNKWKVQQKTLI